MFRIAHLERRLYVANINGIIQREITADILSGDVSMNENGQNSKHTMQCVLRTTSLLQPFVEFLMPWMRITTQSGIEYESYLGLYHVLPFPKRHSRDSSTWAIEARDLTYLLDQSGPTSPYTIASGADPFAAITTIITTVIGVSSTRIILQSKNVTEDTPATPSTMPSAKTWELETDTSWLSIINDVLGQFGYYALHTDDTGRFIFMPYRDLASSEPDTSYFSETGSMIVGELEETPDLTRFANSILVLSGQPAAADTTPVQADSVSPGVANGRTVRVTERLRLRTGVGLDKTILLVMPVGTSGTVTGTSLSANGYTWWPVTMSVTGVGSKSGWCAGNWLETIAGNPDPTIPGNVAAPLKAIRRNTNPALPTSIPNIGEFQRRETPPELETQAQLDEYADRLMQESLTFYNKLLLPTLHDPRRRIHEVYYLQVHNQNGDLITDERWRCIEWTLPFVTNQPMRHTLQRIEAWSTTGVMG